MRHSAFVPTVLGMVRALASGVASPPHDRAPSSVRSPARKTCRLEPALACSAMILIVPAATLARSEEAPRAIIARAVQAMGGEANLLRAHAVQAKIKGTFHDPSMKGSILEGAKFTSEIITQLPSQVKVSLVLETTAGRQGLIQVLNGKKSWTRDREVSQEDDAATNADLKESAYVDYVSTLIPLLKDKAFTLSTAGETEVTNRPAVGISVVSKGHAGVTLYFDKNSGLLIKNRQRRRDPSTRKEIVHEELFTDYQEVNPLGKQEATLRAAHIGTDGPALLNFLQQNTLSEDARKKIENLIRDLGNPSFQVRQKAKQDLIAQGVTAIPGLKQAMRDQDPEVSGLAKECLQTIGKAPDPAAILAAIRLLAARRPAGATAALLNYLPSAPDEAVAQEARAALAAVGIRDGKPDPVLLQALNDKDPQRRAAAVALLGEGRGKPPDRAGQRLFLPGLRWPTKGESYENEKKSREYELIEIQFYSKLDDSVFSQP